MKLITEYQIVIFQNHAQSGSHFPRRHRTLKGAEKCAARIMAESAPDLIMIRQEDIYIRGRLQASSPIRYIWKSAEIQAAHAAKYGEV